MLKRVRKINVLRIINSLMNTKRILLVNIAPQKTGVGNYAKLILEYGNLEYDVLNISFFKKNKALDYPQSINGRTFFYNARYNSLISNFFLVYFKIDQNRLNNYLSNINEKYDAVLLDQQDLAIYAPLFNKKFHCNVYITVHDSGYFGHAKIHPFRFFLDKNFEMLKNNSIKGIMYDSNNTKRDIINKYKNVSDKGKIIELTVDSNAYKKRDMLESRKKLNLPLDKILVLNIGKDGYVKNIKSFIKSLKYIKNENIFYVRVGKLNESQKYLNEMPDEFKKKIIIRKDVSDEDLPYYYNASNIFVFPSINEGFGLEIVEAQLSGDVVITTNREPMNNIALPSASLLINDPFSPVEIANLIDEAAVKYNLMKNNSIRDYALYAERFSINRFIEESENFLAGD